MAETKTKPTGASVDAYLASKASPEQLADCEAIMAMCKRVTKQQPKMWGPSIVGYGSYTYRYESGHSGDASLTGFAVRGKELVVYLIAENPEQVELLTKLGSRNEGRDDLSLPREPWSFVRHEGSGLTRTGTSPRIKLNRRSTRGKLPLSR